MKKYLALVEKFPLVHIDNSEQHRVALRVLGELSERESELTDHEFDYLKVLVTLIDVYEKTLEQPPRKPVSPREAFKFLMEVNSLKQVDISRQADVPQTHISAFLAGTRNLSKTEIGKLSELFKVTPLLFVDDKYFGGASLSAPMSKTF